MEPTQTLFKAVYIRVKLKSKKIIGVSRAFPGSSMSMFRNGATTDPIRPIIEVTLTPIERTSVGKSSAENVNNAQNTADDANFPIKAAILVPKLVKITPIWA